MYVKGLTHLHPLHLVEIYKAESITRMVASTFDTDRLSLAVLGVGESSFFMRFSFSELKFGK